jgi:hypothetical protein
VAGAEIGVFEPKEPRKICFFVGFPRSGTTLAQQMLQAHPAVETLEEKSILSEVCQVYLDKNGNNFQNLQTLPDEERERYRAMYFKRAEALLAEEGRAKSGYEWLVDKMPLSIVHLPFIMTIFPDAKILVALRHPCDCVLSGMMQNFDSNVAMQNLTSLSNGANLYAQAFGLFEKTCAVFKPSVHMFRYEDVVGDTEATLKQICAFLELSWAEDMLDHQKVSQNAKMIRTPSFRQVVEPINQQAKYRWLNYKSHFSDVLPQLKPFIAKYGYKVE